MGEELITCCLEGAGSHDYPGQTSIEYTYRNIAIIRSIFKAMRPFRSDTILLVVANPVDLLTSLAQELSGLPTSQVLGSGTFLDSVRLRGLLADRAGVRAHKYLHRRSNPSNQALGRGQFNKSLRLGRAWRFAGCRMVDCNIRRRPH